MLFRFCYIMLQLQLYMATHRASYAAVQQGIEKEQQEITEVEPEVIVQYVLCHLTETINVSSVAPH